jgi:hypothetical protein
LFCVQWVERNECPQVRDKVGRPQKVAEVHAVKNAFEENEEVLIRLYDQEIAFLTEHLGLCDLTWQRLGQVALSRLSMTIVLSAQRWISGQDPTREQVAEIADLVTAFMLGVPGGLDDQ